MSCACRSQLPVRSRDSQRIQRAVSPDQDDGEADAEIHFSVM